MNPEPRTRQLREYLWFALFLTAVLVGSAFQERRQASMDSPSTATLTVSTRAAK
jgi:hypothetical protein